MPLVRTPYVRPVVGYGGQIVNTSRLWGATTRQDFNFLEFSRGDSADTVHEKVTAEWTSHDPWGNNDMHHPPLFLEATMIRTQYTTEDLKKLPLRGIVAFAARCARRVEPLSQLPADHPQREPRRLAIANAIRLAEEISKGSASVSVEPVVQAIDATQVISGDGIACQCAAAAVAAAARTASTVWLVLNRGESDRDADRWTKTPEARSYLSRLANVTADIVAMDAFTAAVEAADAAAHNDAFMRGAIQDYERLLGLDLGHYPEAGRPIDSSPDGPLGPL
jgi:hypothetical protein